MGRALNTLAVEQSTLTNLQAKMPRGLLSTLEHKTTPFTILSLPTIMVEVKVLISLQKVEKAPL